MFKSFYFFLVSNAERGVAFSAEGFLYGINFNVSNIANNIESLYMSKRNCTGVILQDYKHRTSYNI